MSEALAGDFVTVAEASERWSVPARRIRHVLERSVKRGETPPETLQKTFRTKTGERSAVAYPVAWLGTLIDVENPQAETLQRSVAERSANEAKQIAEPLQRSAPERSELSDWKARALVAEARAELLEKSVADAQKATADTASDRDAWKDQAASLTEALQRAQDEARASRLIGGGRAVQQIEASGLTGGDSSGDTAQGGGITAPTVPEGEKRSLWSWLRRVW